MYLEIVILVTLIAVTATCEEGIQAGTRILGGQYAHVTDFPWQLSLQESFRHSCGASILSARRALTAAHCFNAPPDDPFYTVATVRIQDDPEGHIEVSKIIKHPHYNITTVQRDIAVLWLAQDLIFDYVKIRPVRLPKHSSALRNGMEVFVSGWGRTSNAEDAGIPYKLKWTSLKIVSNKRCEIAYPGDIDADMICAGWSEGLRDTCKGDSGGALVTAGKNAVQIGIVSWGDIHDQGFPSVFTRVSAYVKWIKSVS